MNEITPNKIRILHIGGNLRINGISTFIISLVEGLDSNLFEINVVNSAADAGHYTTKIESNGGKIYSIYTPGTGISRTFGQIKKLKKILNDEGPFDVIHSHYFSNNGYFLKIAAYASVPVRISHCHQSNPNISKLRKLEILISRYLIKKYATHKLSVSTTASLFLYGQYPSQVLYTGIDYAEFNLNKINKQKIYQYYGLDPDKKYLLHIGRFTEQKNQLFLINVFKRIVEINSSFDMIDLIIIGHGPLKEQILRKIDEYQLNSRVIFLNSDVNLAEIYAISTLFLLPSLWEGLGIVLVEAQSMGVRCIASNKITQETNLGLCEYLPLDLNCWTNRIQESLHFTGQNQPIYDAHFDSKNTIQYIKNIYSEQVAERYCDIAKELSLGSIHNLCDRTKSLEYYEKAHRLGNCRGSFGYALFYFEGNGVSQNRQKAHDLVKLIVEKVEILANEGDSRYQIIYGDMFSFGLGKSLDFKEAFMWYKRSANQNNAEALCNLGFCYLLGQGVEQNLKLSSKYWLKSAKLGYAHSCRDIGQNYLNGIGTKKNPKKAIYWFKIASSYNYSHGTSDLAYCYLHGFGLKKNLELAKEYFQKAMDQDFDRGSRAILAAHINLKKFIEEQKMEFNDSTTLTINGIDNIYKGTLYVNDNILSIDSQSFYNSDKLEKILVDTTNSIYSSVDGILFNRDRTILLKYPIGRKVDTYQIPDFVIDIGDYAFQNCRFLKKIIFNQKIQKIGRGAFDDCKNLESIEFKPGLKEIGEWAFHGCDKLKQIFIDASIEQIGQYALGSCEGLELITVDPLNPNYLSIDGNLYDKNGNILYQYAIGKPDKYFKLPDSVKIVAFRAISDAFNLEKVFLPNVKKIEEKAFYYDINLSEVHFRTTPIFEGTQIFDYTHNNLKLILNDNQILEYTNDRTRS